MATLRNHKYAKDAIYDLKYVCFFVKSKFGNKRLVSLQFLKIMGLKQTTFFFQIHTRFLVTQKVVQTLQLFSSASGRRMIFLRFLYEGHLLQMNEEKEGP